MSFKTNSENFGTPTPKALAMVLCRRTTPRPPEPHRPATTDGRLRVRRNGHATQKAPHPTGWVKRRGRQGEAA